VPSTRSAACPYPAAQGLALHGSTLFVADSGNGRVAVWEATPRLRYSRSIGGKGCAAGQLLRPSGLALDATHLYVADSGNHRVCKFTHGGSFVLAVGGYGEAPGQFMLPRGVALCGELMLVAEEGGARVQVLTRHGAPKGQLHAAGFGGLLGICVDPEERCALAAARLGLRLRPTPATPYRYIPSPPLIWIPPQAHAQSLALAPSRRAFAVDRKHNVEQHGHCRTRQGSGARPVPGTRACRPGLRPARHSHAQRPRHGPPSRGLGLNARGLVSHQVVHVLDVCFGGRLLERPALPADAPRSAGKRKRGGGTGGSGSSAPASSSGRQTRQRTRVRRD
jgi:hypothetical protein